MTEPLRPGNPDRRSAPGRPDDDRPAVASELMSNTAPAAEQLAAIRERGVELVGHQDRICLDESAPALAATPGLERARFLGHFSQTLDEFCQVRVGGLKDQGAAGLGAVSPEGSPAAEQLVAIRERVVELVGHQDRIFLDEVAPALAE